MSAKRMRTRAKPGKAPSRGQADLPRLRRLSDREIAQTSPPELADLPADFWAGAALVMPPPKQAISLRVDQDVLEWFKGQGPRYQTKINAVLRSYMAQTRQPTRHARRSRSSGAA